MRIPLATAAMLLAMVAPVEAQPASYTFFGQPGISYHGGTVRLSVVGAPRLGRCFTIEVRSSTTRCGIPSFKESYFVATGVSNQSWAGVTLPLDVTGWQLYSIAWAPGMVTLSGRIYVSFDFVGQVTNYIPRACGRSVLVDVPNEASLMGLAFYNQGFELSGPAHLPDAWVLGLTQGGRGVIGT